MIIFPLKTSILNIIKKRAKESHERERERERERRERRGGE